MQQILSRLWLGDVQDGERAAVPLTAVLNLCEHHYGNLAMVLIHAPLMDEVYLPSHEWQSRVHALQQLLSRGHTVLVHCRLGKSRSPALITAYLAGAGWDLQEALLLVMRRRPLVQIHPETWRGVCLWWDGCQRPVQSLDRDGLLPIPEMMPPKSARGSGLQAGGGKRLP